MALTSTLVAALASALLAMQAPVAPAAQPGAVRITQVNRPDGTQQAWEISQERLAALPPFNASAPVPLSLVEAVDVAQRWAIRQNPGVSRMVVVNAALAPIVRTDTGSSRLVGWHYMVQLVPEDGSPIGILPGAQGEARRVRVVVLMDRSVVEPRIAAATGPAVPNTLSQGPLPPGVYVAGNGVVPPQVKERPNPRYTPEAMRRGIQGEIMMQCTVDTDGRCQDVTVVRSLDKETGLDEEAVKAVREWRFAPGTLNGKPVKVRILVEMSFNLRK